MQSVNTQCCLLLGTVIMWASKEAALCFKYNSSANTPTAFGKTPTAVGTCLMPSVND